jgi:hypothetical protein
MTNKNTTMKAAVSTLGLLGLLALAAHVQAQEASSLSIHGYLTQAYGKAEGGTVAGVPERGTSDYRTAALQFGYEITENDRMVIQFSHERIGEDPVATLLPDVALDWVFYEHKFSNDTRVKIGRVQLPTGIYNEIRDVGTLLPFYRPPQALYLEMTYGETVDGIVASHTFRAGRWSLHLEPFYGSAEAILPVGGTVVRSRASDIAGGSVWLRTPLEGVRVGGSGFRSALKIPSRTGIVYDKGETWRGAIDATFSRVTARGEYTTLSHGLFDFSAYYGEASVKVVDKVSVNLQYSRAWLTTPTATTPFSRDMAAGVNYAFLHNVVLKLEGHEGEGSVLSGSAPEARYGLLSLSASF